VTVRRLKPALALQAVIATAGFALAILEFDFPPALLALAGALALFQLWSLSLVLRVDDEGVRMAARSCPGARSTPWWRTARKSACDCATALSYQTASGA
jgi:hypothetical protein